MFASNTLIFSTSRGSGGISTPPPVEPSGTSLTVVWEDNSEIETGFRVRYRPAGSGAYTLATTTAANVETATITGLEYGTSYDVTVAAYKAGNIPEEYSQVGPITRYTPPEFAPTDLTAGTITATTVEINNTPAAGVTKYQGHYRPGTSGAWLTGPSITSGTSINFTGLAVGATYQFKIAGYFTNPDIEAVIQTPSYSPDSAYVSVMTSVPPTSALQTFISGLSPEHWWRLNEPTSSPTVADSGSIGDGGTVAGGVDLGVTSSGPTFTAATINTSGLVDFGALQSFLSGRAAPVSIGLRLKMAADATTCLILGKWGYDGASQRLALIYDTNGKLTVVACNGPDYLIAETAAGCIVGAAWYSISVVWATSTTFTLYVNGASIGLTYSSQPTISSLPSTPDYNFYIGYETGSPAVMQATIHDVFIISRVLTEEEITAHAAAAN